MYEVVSSFKNFGRGRPARSAVAWSSSAGPRPGALRMFVSVRRPESLSLSLAVLASLSEVIMDQIPLENSVPKVREVVALWVGIRIQMSPHRNTCVIRDFTVTVVSSAREASWLRWGQ